MSRLVVDISLSPLWVAVFAGHGWSAVHWSTIGDPGAKDRIVMAWARENGYVVFTHDLDFGTLLALTRGTGPSVIQVRTDDQAMRRIQYLVRINRDPHSDWGASVPDLPGCVATGKTLDSALRRIEQALALHVRGLREDGLPVPRPSHRTVTPRRRPREIDFYATVEVAA